MRQHSAARVAVREGLPLDRPPAAFARLLDDAAIFPPGNAPMALAVDRHRDRRRGPEGALIGPFVCSLARLGELSAALGELDGRPHTSGGERLEVAVVVPPGGDLDEAERAAPGLDAVTLEATAGEGSEMRLLGELARRRERRDQLAVYLEPAELPCEERIAERAGALGVALKLRTGGLVPAAFPSERRLAEAIAAAAAAGVAFKCTAGLHRAVRHRAADGLEHHGFLNVLVAAGAAWRRRARVPEIAAILAERDGEALVAALGELGELGGPSLAALRRESFRSFGTCSLEEPIEDLRRLRLLA